MLKKYLVAVLSGVIILAITACGNVSISTDVRKEETTFKKEELSLPTMEAEHKRLNYSYEIVIVKNDKIYGCYHSADGRNTLVVEDIEEDKILREVETDCNGSILCISVDKIGNIYLIESKNDINNAWKIALDDKVTLLENFVLEDQDPIHNTILKGIYIDKEDRFYLWTKVSIPYSEVNPDAPEDVWARTDRIYIKDSNMNTITYVQIPDCDGMQLLGIVEGETGNISLLAKNAEGYYVQNIDEKGEGEPEFISELSLQTNCDYIAKDGEDIILIQGNSVYKYTKKQKGLQRIMNLSSYGIDATKIIYFGKNSEGIEIVDYYGQNKDTEYTILKEGEDNKKEITLATIQMQGTLEDIVTSYNRYNSQYRVKVIDYYDPLRTDMTIDECIDNLYLSIIQGNAADILDVSLVDYDMLGQKGGLTDLYQMIQRDPEISTDMLEDNIIKQFQTGNRLYAMAPAFQIYSMWGKETLIQGRDSVSVHELSEMLKQRNKSIDAIYGFSADESVLTTLCTMSISQFVDWDKKTCNFEQDDFYQILNFAKEYTGGYSEGSIMQGVREDQILLTIGIITDTADHQIQKKIYGENISYIGYPGTQSSGSAVGFRGSQLAINAKSAQEDDAWDFLKYYILNGYCGEGFPIIKEQLESKWKTDMEKQFSTSIDGNYEKPHGVFSDSTEYIEVFEASEQDVEEVKELIAKVDCKYQYHTEIQKIIEDEVAAYLQGQKTKEEVAELIQNRVSLYLKE